MAFVKIKKLLHETIGLHSNSIGESSIDRAINHRMQVSGASNADLYYRFLKAEPAELKELIEEVVVPETWFFRNSEPFDVLREYGIKALAGKFHVSPKIKNDAKKAPLRILSAPCSSGEEPYSIAITLCEAGYEKHDFLIDAIDISSRALKKAKQAIYGKHSFREKGVEVQERYFSQTPLGFQLDAAIRDQVSFRYGNILQDQIAPSPGCYDIIFCRNLLIYFDRGTQKRIIDKLAIMLKPGGLFFVGHAESGQIDKNVFSKVLTTSAFAYRKKTTKNQIDLESSPHESPAIKLRDVYDQLVKVTEKDIALSEKFSTLKKRAPPVPQMGAFSEVDKLIGFGHLDAASTLCEEFLRDAPENPDGYYYLGLICNLQGNVGSAKSLLRKAISLSPDHQKALSLSACLAESNGDESEC
jgi:chemotaxis protein methyltransferase WspC